MRFLLIAVSFVLVKDTTSLFGKGNINVLDNENGDRPPINKDCDGNAKTGVITQQKCEMYFSMPVFEAYDIKTMIGALDPDAAAVCFILQKGEEKNVSAGDSCYRVAESVEEYRIVYPKTFKNSEILDQFYLSKTPPTITDPEVKKRFEEAAPDLQYLGFSYTFSSYTTSEAVDHFKNQTNWTTFYENCEQ